MSRTKLNGHELEAGDTLNVTIEVNDTKDGQLTVTENGFGNAVEVENGDGQEFILHIYGPDDGELSCHGDKLADVYNMEVA